MTKKIHRKQQEIRSDNDRTGVNELENERAIEIVNTNSRAILRISDKYLASIINKKK